MHDVNIGKEDKSVLDRPDKIIGLTPWHSSHLQRLYDLPVDKMAILPHGTEPERFPLSDWDKTNPLRMIYSSSADRGLDTLLSMWPIVRGRYTEAELHIFYGWDIIDKVIRSSRQRNAQTTWLEEFKNKCIGQIEACGGEEGGIFQHGRVNQDVLAKEMAKSSVWPYPTQFMETYCITALEMQMAGVTPVTSSLAGLNDTIWPEYTKVEGWPLNTSYQKQWLNLLAAVIDQPDWQDWARKEAREYAEKITWDAAYGKWNDLINSCE
jgi:glycosyltransferase involved in cell wall biosynthesis